MHLLYFFQISKSHLLLVLSSFVFFFNPWASYHLSPWLIKTYPKDFPVICCGSSFKRFSFSYLALGWELKKRKKTTGDSEMYSTTGLIIKSSTVLCFFFSLKSSGLEPQPILLLIPPTRLQTSWLAGTAPSGAEILPFIVFNCHCPGISCSMVASLLPTNTIFF